MRIVLSFLVFMFSLECHSETYKLQSVSSDSKTTCHGNAFAVTSNKIVTCWHVVEGKGEHRILVGKEWVKAVVVKKDVKLDICVLSVDAKLSPVEFCIPEFLTVGAAKYEDIKKHYVSMKSGILKSEYSIGISGSPLFYLGKLFGMIVSVDNEHTPTVSTFISASLIKEFLDGD